MKNNNKQQQSAKTAEKDAVNIKYDINRDFMNRLNRIIKETDYHIRDFNETYIMIKRKSEKLTYEKAIGGID